MYRFDQLVVKLVVDRANKQLRHQRRSTGRDAAAGACTSEATGWCAFYYNSSSAVKPLPSHFQTMVLIGENERKMKA